MRIASTCERAKFYTDFLYHERMIRAVQGGVKRFDGLKIEKVKWISHFSELREKGDFCGGEVGKVGGVVGVKKTSLSIPKKGQSLLYYLSLKR